MGIPTENFEVVNVNQGFGNISTRILESINKKFPIIKDGVVNLNGRKHIGKSIDNDKFLLTEKEYEKIAPSLKAESNKLVELLGVRFKEMEVPFSEEVKIDELLAVKIYEEYAEPHTSRLILSFIKSHSSFPISKLCNYFKENVLVLRDVAILLEDENILDALHYMKLARLIRPDGIQINNKIAEYEEIIKQNSL
ncbi:hypothetical protein P20652_1848 [Pseudoalteromonas sp. BSi20652]|uniref:hypothetical protein n=1 Tax=Pseudoalteromonas sp. BSi20652 TaxID=388384 RepID=UPI0002318BA5|nr:hypothetical protein [Pseudoalteromonas sp. BSi20652]GAA59984.1 hypothetical protein P20652_1848 [Pseudoalteromonas sp. BSi20652]